MKPNFLPFAFLVVLNSFCQEWQPLDGKIMSRWAKEVTPDNVWQEYPRPQFERSTWKNLNGMWDYVILKPNQPKPKSYEGKILVPFSFESALSGVGRSITPEDKMWYRKKFIIPSEWKGKRILLNFEAVDHDTNVWVNDIFVGSHKGGFDRFSFDITTFLNVRGNQTIEVSVKDGTNLSPQLRGKQHFKPSGIVYTPVSGIWQTVWLEAVSNEAYLGEVKITTDIDKGIVKITPFGHEALRSSYKVKASIYKNKSKIAEGSVSTNKLIELKIREPKLWSPDNPNIYDLKLTLTNPKGKIIDQVDSYFGMRKISLGNHKGVKYLFLNNKPLFHYGTLDQGWWPDGLLTPPSDAAMRYDIEITKAMGFNMIRKHVKIEPDRWYYHCDHLGILVWQDMPSGGKMVEKINGPTTNKRGDKKYYTNLQHVGRTDGDLNKNINESIQFETELRKMINIHYNSPSIVVWVPFNEGWGQYDTCRISDLVKALDSTRLVIPTSGWSLRNCGDIYDIHTYDVDLKKPPYHQDRATVIGEYGGIGLPIKKNLWNPNTINWGYQTYNSQKELIESYEYKFNQILKMKEMHGLSGAVYTQTTDVEGEVNGLLTYDREVIKIPTEILKNLHSPLYKESN
ncbi:MAG: sugar-binding domain-containing protein [Bacteroidota bacterium]|nr:sugar-binding domain-containing protein [Bacteroidota bacterium]